MTATVLSWVRAQVAVGAHWHLDSRQVGAGDLFLACPGEVTDGRDYIDAALAAGAAAILIEEDARAATLVDALQARQVAALAVPNLAAQAARLAAEWYGQPSAQLQVVAITGTNGKTSCTQWLAQALQQLSIPCGVIGTLGSRLPDGRALATPLTTPDGVTLQRVLAQMLAAGARVVALEASSIGLAQGRLDAVQVAYAGLTNLSRDHLDYHGDMTAYAAAKQRLFRWPGLKGAVINANDALGQQLLQALPSLPTVAYGVGQAPAPEGVAQQLWAECWQLGAAGLQARCRWGNHPAVDVFAPVVGRHNLENILLVAGLMLQLGQPWPQVVAALAALQPVPGRLQPVAGPESLPAPLVVVDYAHTPDALARVLGTLREVARQRGGALICVFGCGGNRDAGKRPDMGRVAAELADTVWLTSDNPRDESPATIMAQVRAGRPVASQGQWHEELERARAILFAIAAAAPADVVVLAGKGHESTQEIAGRHELFLDAEWARLALWLPRLGPVATDTRSLPASALYVALQGERFDGNQFVDQAFAAGAAGAVVATLALARQGDQPRFALGDGVRVLAHLAALSRQQFRGPLIAVTGSNGKTTTKEMIAAILRAWLGPEAVLATRGNLNNAIGVPLTLLELKAAHRAAVLELGMNHPGEIAGLAELAAPDVALVNNAQREHQEFMHSVAAVARENGCVLQALGPDGVAVYPGDDEHTATWQAMAGERRSLLFGAEAPLAVHPDEVQMGADGSRFRLVTPEGSIIIRLPISGLHNVRNALAAAACALAAGCPLPAVAVGLSRFQPVAGRLVMALLPNQVQVVDDTYNANPDSVRAAIEVLATLAAPRLLVLGDMGEVGSQGPQMHAEVGRYARDCGIERLLCLGEASRAAAAAFGEGARHVATPDDAVQAILQEAPASVLFKGSRFMRMERVLTAYRVAVGADKESGDAA